MTTPTSRALAWLLPGGLYLRELERQAARHQVTSQVCGRKHSRSYEPERVWWSTRCSVCGDLECASERDYLHETTAEHQEGLMQAAYLAVANITGGTAKVFHARQ